MMLTNYFRQLMINKCVKNNVLLKLVNPAYTSMIGEAKYMNNYGISIHEAAATAIGRRGLGFREAIPHRLSELVKVQRGQNELGEFAMWKGLYRKKGPYGCSIKYFRKKRIELSYRKPSKSPPAADLTMSYLNSLVWWENDHITRSNNMILVN